MELQDIKANWDVLSKRIDKLEIENDALLKEISNNKMKSNFGRMKRTEQRLLWVSVFAFIYIAVIGFYGALSIATIIMFCFILLLSIIWQLYRVRFLNKLNLLNPPIELLRKMNRYKIESKYRFIIGLFVAFLIITLTVIFEQNYVSPTTMKGIYGGAVIGLILGLWYDRQYLKQLNALIAELKEITECSK